MSEKVKVYIDLDQSWVFFPQEYGVINYVDECINEGKCVEIDVELLNRYNNWRNEGSELYNVFETLYKQQNCK